MAIAQTDIKLRKSQRLTDNPDGGGRMVQAEVVDQEMNNLFPDIGDEERTTGRTTLRKAFVHVDTADTDVLKDAIGVILRQPQDSHISMVMMGLGSYSDTRTEARNRIESYITKGVESRYLLLGNHFVGQQALMIYCMADAPTPEINDNFCLATSQPGYDANEQYVRISRILDRTTQNFYDDDGAFQRDVIIVEIGSALLFNFYGMPSPSRLTRDKPPTRVHDTNVVDAATYATVKVLAEPAALGDLSVKVDSPYVQIVPSTVAETPVVDVLAGQGTISYVPAGASNSLGHNFSAGFTAGVAQTRYLGSPLARGSVRAVAGAVELVDDGSGRLAATGVSPWSGSIDYAVGAVSVQHDTGIGSASVAITATPAGPIAEQGYTQKVKITPANQGFTYLFDLIPLPAPGTVTVAFRALGKWIVLSDNGTGQLVGRPGQGGGTINYTTGSLVVTAGALPDLGSVMVVGYGTGVVTERREGDISIKPPRLAFLLAHGGIVPGTASFTWQAGGSPVTATDDSAGVLKVGATAVGTISYATGDVALQLPTLPDSNTGIAAAYDYAEREDASFTPVPDGGGIGTFTLSAAPVRAGTVALTWQISVKPSEVEDLGSPSIPLLVEVRDDGAGDLVAVHAGGALFSTVLGSINYTTGAVSCQFGSFVISNVPVPRYMKQGAVGDNNGYLWRVSGRQRVSAQANFSAGTVVSAQWQTAGSSDTAATEDLPLPAVELDLTPGVIDPVVPGSVRFTFKGRTYVDRAGSLYADIDPQTGAGTYAGSMNYANGLARLALWAAGGSNAVTIRSLLTRLFEPGIDAMFFRTPGSPLRPGAFTLRGNTLDGTLINASADIGGNLTGPLIDGLVDWESGTVDVRFGEYVPAAGNEGEPWYDPANVVGPNVWRPQLVIPSSLYIGAVVFRSIPLSSVVVGLDPTRLPSDGRVPGFKAGQTLLIHHTQETNVSPTPGQVVNLGRTALSEIEVRDAEGVPVLSDWYVLDLDAGTVTFSDPLNLSAYTLPLAIRDSIENRRLCAGVQITGDIEINSALSRAFPAGSMVSSALRLGEANGSLDLVARVERLFDIQTWNPNLWLDQLGPGQTQAPGTYNETDFPLVVTNADAITERWALVFANATTFSVVGETVGTIATNQSTTVDCAPLNPRTGLPYFQVDRDGFGGGWATGNAIRFNTIGGLAPIWFARCTKPGTPETDVDSFRYKTIGNTAGATP